MARRTKLKKTTTAAHLTRRSATARIVRPDSLAWQAAMKLADGDPHRIEVISTTELVVHNRAR